MTPRTSAPALPVTWLVANDAAVTDVVATGTFVTNADRDWTVKARALCVLCARGCARAARAQTPLSSPPETPQVLVEGLTPGSTYYFAFVVGGVIK